MKRRLDHDTRRMAQADALAGALRRAARRSGTEAWTAPVPREGMRMLDKDLDTPAALRLLRELTEARNPGALSLARHLGLRLGRRS